MTSLRMLLVGSSRPLLFAILLVAIAVPGMLAEAIAAEVIAAAPAAENNVAAGKALAAPAGAPVEMFAAMNKGDLDVKFIPKNDREATVILKNNTKLPLNVKLPEAFAGVPVLAQRRRGGAAGGMGGMGMGGGMMNQGMGGGMGGMGMGGMGGGGMGGMGGGGMFNIPPEQVRKLTVDTVCLEHGKKDPRPAIPYEIHPIESFTTKPGVAELCAMLGHGKIDQRAAQVAAWHLNSGLSWDELAAKRIEHLDGQSEPYFSPEQLQLGLAVSNSAEAMAAEAAANGTNRKPAPEPTGSLSGESASQR